MEQKQLTIEHHAVMYGYLAKEAMAFGTAGRCALAKATVQYGKERGKRMAESAKKEGIECTMPAYSVFKEWRPTAAGQMILGDSVKSPEFVTTVKRCEWVESWKRHGLLEYGNYYCRYVDQAIVKGFNKELNLEIAGLQSLGDPMCIFNWGYERTDTVEAELAKMRKKAGDTYVQDFAFHTAHLYATIIKVLAGELGESAKQIGAKAMEQFVEKFDSRSKQVIENIAAENGWHYKA